MNTHRVLVAVAATALLSAASLALAPAASAHGRHHHVRHHAVAAAQPVQPVPGPLPDASTVVLRPVQDHVVLTTSTSTSTSGRTSTSAALDWVVPACTGTVSASFQLDQDGVYVKVKGATAYPCAATDQTVAVTYWAADPGQPLLHPGNVVLRTQTSTTDPATGVASVLLSTSTTLPAVTAAA